MAVKSNSSFGPSNISLDIEKFNVSSASLNKFFTSSYLLVLFIIFYYITYKKRADDFEVQNDSKTDICSNEVQIEISSTITSKKKGWHGAENLSIQKIKRN